MSEVINRWREYDEASIRGGYASRETDPEYPALVVQAKARGFVPAPLSALLASGNNEELYTWRGRVWVEARRNGPEGR